MSLGVIRRRILGALKNFISELSLDGDGCVKQYVPYSPVEPDTLEQTTVLLLLGVIASLAILIIVLLITLVHYAKKQSRASTLMLQQVGTLAKSFAELSNNNNSNNNNNNNNIQSTGDESMSSVESACDCCEKSKPSTDSTDLVNEDSAFDANEGTFVNVLDEMIITDESERLLLASKFKESLVKPFTVTNGHDDDEDSDASVENITDND